MMLAIIGRCASVLLLTAVLGSSALAQKEAPAIRVAVTIVPPVVFEDGGSLTGFDIELWNAIAVRLKKKTDYVIVPGVNDLFDALRSTKVDLTIPTLIT